jgi:hypothetical protein
MKVSANTLSTFVHTDDEQGLCQRTVTELIVHAAHRYAVRAYPPVQFFLSVTDKDPM